jgi:hypothetical protein
MLGVDYHVTFRRINCLQHAQKSQQLYSCWLFYSSGGRGEIRTHGGREPTTVFKTVALNRSATLPAKRHYSKELIILNILIWKKFFNIAKFC